MNDFDLVVLKCLLNDSFGIQAVLIRQMCMLWQRTAMHVAQIPLHLVNEEQAYHGSIAGLVV